MTFRQTGFESVESRGDPGLVTFMRSAAKPIQALPLARAREDLDDRDLAIASASHLADDHQLMAVTALLGLGCGAGEQGTEALRRFGLERQTD